MSFAPPRSDSSPLFQNLNIFKFFDMIDIQNVLFLRNVYQESLPKALLNTYDVQFIHVYKTRRETDGLINSHLVNTTSFGLKSVKIQAIKSWNKLQPIFPEFKFVNASNSKIKKILKNILLNRINCFIYCLTPHKI